LTDVGQVDGRSVRRMWWWVVGVVALVVVAGLLVVVAVGGEGDPVDESSESSPATSQTSTAAGSKYRFVKDLCEKLDWSAIEDVAAFSDTDHREESNGMLSRCVRNFADNDDPGAGQQSDVWFEAVVVDTAEEAADNLDRRREEIYVPEDVAVDLLDDESSWDEADLWGTKGTPTRCIFFGRHDNLSITFSLTVHLPGIEGLDDEEFSQLVLGIVEQTRELTAV
jgi:hypothetical protein